MPVEIAAVGPAELDRVRPFTDRAIRPDFIHTQEWFFRWQFCDPEGVLGDGWEPATWMAVDAGEVVAISLAIKSRFWVKGCESPGAWHTDWFADEGHPGAGLRLIEEQLRRNPVLGSAGHSLNAAIVFGMVRPLVWFDLERLFLCIDPAATDGLLFSDETTRHTAAHQRAFLKLQRVAKPDAATTGEPLERFDDDYDRFWQALRQRFALATDRSAAYMNWRYTNHPAFGYRRLRCETPAGPAYFVWREEPVAEHPRPVARITEALGEPEALARSVSVLYQTLREHEIAFADFFCSNAEVNDALVAGGLRPAIALRDFDLPRLFSPLAREIRKTLNFGYSVAPELGPVHERRRTYLSKGDANQDRPNP